MASTNGVIFPESMADILANPVDICFGLMPATSTTPAACLVIEGNAVTTNHYIETDLSTETHPPTPTDLVAGIDRVEGMLSDTIKVCERVKCPRTTPLTSSMPLGLRNAAHVASRYMKRKIQIESGLYSQDHGSRGNHLDEPCPIHEKSKHTARQCRVLKKFRRPLTAAHRRRLNLESSSDRLAF
jgi:spore coat protein U-like protein